MDYQNRQLAAILFADIAGYTALMQKDEQAASTLLRRFQKEIEEKVAEHNGRIVNFYGDGALCTFNNPLEAVRCSMALQSNFQTAPNVPVRIGLHSGTVVSENGKVYGDSVNLASRIESMGVPGAILFSKKIRDEIKNQPDFKIQSLGNFDFKNVEEEMEVFTLTNEGFVIPKRDEMKGKLKARNTKINRKVIPLFGILLILFVAIWVLQKNNNQLPESIQKSRIAILPYGNNTNDPALNILGEMASDWIIQGMMNFDNLKVISYQTVKENLPYISLASDSKQSFYARTGAEKIIRGSFYQDKESLIFQSQIVDVQTGEIEFAFPEITGNVSSPTSIIQELRERILSYFSISNSRYFTEALLENPPKYEAYKMYEEAGNYFGVNYKKAIPLYYSAIGIDSSFYWPYQQLLFAYSNLAEYTKADSIIWFIDNRFRKLTPYEKIYFDYSKVIMTNNLEAMYAQSKKLFEKDPKNVINNYLTGMRASETNRPNQSIEYFQHIDPSVYPVDLKVSTWWHNVYAGELIRLNRLNEAMNLLQYVPNDKASYGIFFRKQEIYVLRNQPDSIKQMLKTLEESNFPNWLIHDLYIESIEEYALQNDFTNQMDWAKLSIERINNQPESIELDKSSLAAAYFLSEQYDKALPLYKELAEDNSSSDFNLGRLGCCFAKLNQTENALEIVKDLENKGNISPKNRGEFQYAIAGVYAMLGEKQKAVNYLKYAYKKGFWFSPERYRNAFEFIPLHDYPAFEEFVKPKG